jgi:hypothetical protein
LTVTAIRLRENLYEGLFFPKAERSYRVFFGGRDLRAPAYDVGAILQTIPAEAADAWSLGAASANPVFKTGNRSPWFNSKKLFSIAIVAMIIVLAWAIVRSVGKIDRLGQE